MDASLFLFFAPMWKKSCRFPKKDVFLQFEMPCFPHDLESLPQDCTFLNGLKNMLRYEKDFICLSR